MHKSSRTIPTTPSNPSHWDYPPYNYVDWRIGQWVVKREGEGCPYHLPSGSKVCKKKSCNNKPVGIKRHQGQSNKDLCKNKKNHATINQWERQRGGGKDTARKTRMRQQRQCKDRGMMTRMIRQGPGDDRARSLRTRLGQGNEEETTRVKQI